MVSGRAADLFFAGLLAGAVVAGVLSAACFVTAIGWRLWLVGRRRRFERLRARWLAVFAGGPGAPAATPDIDVPDALIVLQLWNRLRATATEKKAFEERHRLDGLARRVGLQRSAIAALRRRGPSDRVVALTTLGSLREPAALQAARSMLGRKNAPLSLAAYRTLVMIRPQEIVRFLRAVVDRPDWSILEVDAVLHELDEHQTVAGLRCALQGAGTAAKRTLLRYLATSDSARARIVALAMLPADGDPVMTIAALRALRKHVRAIDRPLIKGYLRDDRPPLVRLAALNTLVPICVPDDADLMVGLLNDTNYWVRLRAAQALSVAGGTEEASRIAERIDDRYGREILRQVVTERRWEADLSFAQPALELTGVTSR